MLYNSFCYLFFSNSEYNYLWNIINDTTKSLTNVYLLIDDNLQFKFNDNINIRYYQNTFYSNRFNETLDELKNKFKYVILIYDVDLILSICPDTLNDITKLMDKYNIHRVSLGVFPNSSNYIKTNFIHNSIQLRQINNYNISKSFLTPFDYAPSIYNVDKLLSFYSNFPNLTYQEFEHKEKVQQYIKENFNVYGINNNENLKLVYHRGFVFCSKFSFLHITVKKELLPIHNYFDLQEKLISIIDKYNLNFLQINPKYNLNKNLLTSN